MHVALPEIANLRIDGNDGGILDEGARLVAERQWLNAALLKFDSSPSDDEHKRSGHA